MQRIVLGRILPLDLDHQLFLIINSFAGNTPPLDTLARLVVNDYFVPTTLTLLLVALWFEPHPGAGANRQAVLRAIVAILIANLFVKIFNLVYFRPRPFFDNEVNLLFYRPSDSSFPSNSAAVGFAFAGAIWPQNRFLGWAMAILASLFSLARVYAGVHFPLDILGGAVLGLVAARTSFRLDTLLQPIYDLAIGVAGRLGLM
ncbi:MAG: phosphatase PAP2 family protein [Chloroflexi bacterium]|nr:phosphatase PAP2 family protein [Chloroflexota bacterium]